MRTCPGSLRGTARPRAEPSPSPIRRVARSPPAHGPRLVLLSMRWLARARRAAPPSRGDPACGIGRTLRRPRAPSPRRVGPLRAPPAAMGRRKRPPVPVRALVQVLARDRERVRVGEAEGEAPDGAPGSAGPAELLAGAWPRVVRGAPTPRGGGRAGLAGAPAAARAQEAAGQSDGTISAGGGGRLPASARLSSEA